jgi:hypothetical protein
MGADEGSRLLSSAPAAGFQFSVRLQAFTCLGQMDCDIGTGPDSILEEGGVPGENGVKLTP